MRLALTGDVMLGRLVNEYINQYGPEYPFGDVAELLRADLSLINLECVIAKSGKEWMPPKAFYFKADPIAIETLKKSNITCTNLANNHTLDFQEEALIETIERLDKAGIKHVGAGKNIEEAEKFVVIEKNGTRFGIIGFSDYPKEWAATKNKSGINYIEISDKGIEKIKKVAKEMKKECDVAIMTIHWGPNMRQQPTEAFRKFARTAIDAGIDIYHGHSAHIFQGIEIYKGKPIFYDTGDFVDDYYVSPEEKNDQQLLFLIDVDENGIRKITLVPLIIYMCQVNKTKPDSYIFEEICNRMINLSKEMGTDIIRKKNHMEIMLHE